MKPTNTRRRAETLSLCADLYEDDCRPPRRGEDPDDRSDDRKTMQLCAQVRRALHGMIPCPGSPGMDGLMVESVEADDHGPGRLHVVVSVPASCELPIPVVRQRLTAMTGYLRAEIAAQITRKRVPLLAFQLVPREDEP
ncbi:MAG: ribosome-binding factor A [Phycisphaerales bacterium]